MIQRKVSDKQVIRNRDETLIGLVVSYLITCIWILLYVKFETERDILIIFIIGSLFFANFCHIENRYWCSK